MTLSPNPPNIEKPTKQNKLLIIKDRLKVEEVDDNEREIATEQPNISVSIPNDDQNSENANTLEVHQRHLTNSSEISLNTVVNPSCPIRSREIYTDVDEIIKSPLSTERVKPSSIFLCSDILSLPPLQHEWMHLKECHGNI